MVFLPVYDILSHILKSNVAVIRTEFQPIAGILPTPLSRASALVMACLSNKNRASANFNLINLKPLVYSVPFDLVAQVLPKTT